MTTRVRGKSECFKNHSGASLSDSLLQLFTFFQHFLIRIQSHKHTFTKVIEAYLSPENY